MYRFTLYSKKSLPLFRPLTNVKVIDGSNASSLRNSFPLISGYRQISLNSSDREASSSNNVGDSNIGN